MKIRISLLLLVFVTSYCHAKDNPISSNEVLKNKQELQQVIQEYLKPRGVLVSSYDEFDFSSNQGVFFNNYSGHTNYNSVGGDYLRFYNLYWGFNGYNLSSNMNVSSFLSNNLNHGQNIIEDNGFYFHVMKQLYSPVFIDVFATYARDRFTLINTVSGGGLPAPLTGFSKYYGKDNSIGARTFFGYPYKKLFLQGYLTYFYSQFYQPNYIVSYPTQNVIVPELVTKIGTTIEHARLYYQVNDRVSPFVSGGLIQLLSRSFSRPIIDPAVTVVSALPQILLDKNGYSVGAGVDFNFRALRLTPVYVYSARGSTYTDNYVGITVELVGMA
ncbi:autotransporter outer membrane beta-barrel domain-containing protein [Legionella pneumophila serogroup 1]|nr:hypothetical protein [Legionella pneumophila]HAU0206717.1 autotransporter outer membrane beta-barrel domain-containing protein [Legionella pneumophila]HAU0707929.1 autotransporter outer membrane beta-barrel domain-containing protein [Legionella pneumophila]HAU1131480.1 autotransporter outer membrane beta-barrel domain-containing protein [Legionella pneumophila]HAU1293865.1 autotransporter outer membrane beta-barrel domain-containing protein [Legionella pneumophila]